MTSNQNKPLVTPARRRAFDILRRVETEGAYASVLLAANPRESDLSREDRALAQELVLGVLRWQLSLDNLIERYSQRQISRLDSAVVIALRLGLYQLRYLTRIPQSAAVNESVNLVKHARVASAGGFVNAVLRRAAKNPQEFPSAIIEDPAEQAAVEMSHPRWMLDRWRAELGDDETRELALANNTASPTAFRVNTLRTTIAAAIQSLEAGGVTARESDVAGGAFVVEKGPAHSVLQAAEEGLIYIQDQASQLVSQLLNPTGGQRILDLCAAPGSKTSHIAALTDDKAWIVACDRRPQRLQSLQTACARLGIGSVDTVALDATQPLPWVESATRFDRVLVDAPCSGTGTLRSNPEIKWRLSVADIQNLAVVQLRLLERGAAAVAEGGRLVYSTCSIEREENEAVLENFMEENQQFELSNPKINPKFVTSDGFVRTFPHRHGTDGFFAAVLERVR